MASSDRVLISPRVSGRNLELHNLDRVIFEKYYRLGSRTGMVLEKNFGKFIEYHEEWLAQQARLCKHQPIGNPISFIVQEMTTNVGSSDFQYMKDNLEYWQWDNFLIPGKHAWDILQAFHKWFTLVKPGGPWDHKKKIYGTYGEEACDYTSRKSYRYDIWSNIHYGYIGLAAGFSEWDLLGGAGGGQILARLKGYQVDLPGFWEYWERRFGEFGDADFVAAFDDPKDQEAIKVGFELWENYGTSVAAHHVLNSCRQHALRLATKPY